MTFSPGAFLPFSGQGSAYEADRVSLHWAIASGGAIQPTARTRDTEFVFTFAAGRYGRCAATGYRAPLSTLVRRGNRTYLPEFAPEEG